MWCPNHHFAVVGVEQKSGTMHKVINRAYVVHRTLSRMRVRIPGRRHDHAYFKQLRQRLIGSVGVIAVEVNPLTASVLIECSYKFKLATLGAVGIELAPDEHGASRQNHSLPQGACYGAMAKRDDGAELLTALARLVGAAVTGRLWSHILEQLIGWCAEALIDAMVQPADAAAQVIRLAHPPRPRQ
jgi:hypothetical protein